MDEYNTFDFIPDSIERFYPGIDTLESMIKLLCDREVTHYLHFKITDKYILVKSYKR